VSWVGHGGGLFFGKYGSILSAGAFKPGGQQSGSSCSIELWLEPKRVNNSGTVLAFYRPETRVVPFALRQFRDVLLVQLPGRSGLRDAKVARFYVTHFFSREKPVFVAISSGPSGTAVYADGVLVKTFPAFKFSSRDLTGQLIVGNSPASTHNWSGRLWRLAIYRRELSAGEISEQHGTTTREDHPGMTDIITNTLGTALGATLCARIARHQWLARAGIKIPFPGRN
jgi:hypothetical protein